MSDDTTHTVNRIIRYAVGDPASIVPRDPGDLMTEWQAKAVRAALAKNGWTIVRVDALAELLDPSVESPA